MNPGDLITRMFQYELMGPVDGLLLGASTPFQVLQTNIEDLPEVKTSDFVPPGSHGGFAGIDFSGVRKIQVKMAIDGTEAVDFQGEFTYLLSQLQKLLRPSSDDLYFSWLRPGYSTPRRCLVKPRKRDFPLDSSAALGWTQGGIELWAYDPKAYSVVPSGLALVINSGSSSRTGLANSTGTVGTGPLITFTGPTTNPRITNSDDGNRTMKFTVAMAPTDVMVVDSIAESVTINGIDRYDVVASDNQWWELQPGDNHLSFNRTGTSSVSTASITWRDAYL